jgi:hypothetical protein
MLPILRQFITPFGNRGMFLVLSFYPHGVEYTGLYDKFSYHQSKALPFYSFSSFNIYWGLITTPSFHILFV